MSLHALASGALVADPVRRTGAKGDYVTATLRVPTDDGGILVSTIAFGAAADRLRECDRGDEISVSGRARLTEWTGRDGQQRRGLSIVAEQIATVRPLSRDSASRTRRPRPAYRSTPRDNVTEVGGR